MLVGPTTLPNVFRPQPSSKTRAQHHVWSPPPFKALSPAAAGEEGRRGPAPRPQLEGPKARPSRTGTRKKPPHQTAQGVRTRQGSQKRCGCVSVRVVSKYLHVPLNKYGLKSGLGREKRVPGMFGAFQSRAGGSRPPGAPLHALVWLPREPESAADRGQHSGIRILTLPPTTRA